MSVDHNLNKVKRAYETLDVTWNREFEILALRAPPIKEMEKSDASGQGQVNYKDFLKFSYLCLMYLNHFDLEFQLRELDKEKKGLVTVAQLDQILQSKDSFAFPPTALDEVFTEMLG